MGKFKRSLSRAGRDDRTEKIKQLTYMDRFQDDLRFVDKILSSNTETDRRFRDFFVIE